MNKNVPDTERDRVFNELKMDKENNVYLSFFSFSFQGKKGRNFLFLFFFLLLFFNQRIHSV